MVIIENIKKQKIFKMLYIFTKLIMGFAFIISGIRKLPEVQFTILSSTDNPVGAYFYAMEQTGFYWNFIGYFQILIGILIWFNRTTVASAVLMMPVTINIFLISIALNMRGTPVITV
ncbi:hypothetical protein [Polaribacter porphyrae]|uniref:DoxX family protein n=1 Tax=Polaribacter porphyrae TaxID=1137780 RepID=A0A2S7WRC0_9FLAO|nr:hypothetical protein [Polaribacter porphyrae]PQJ79862.1 hypothetical protein BTO18_12055 [Polaribacter porphyrae]